MSRTPSKEPGSPDLPQDAKYSMMLMDSVMQTLEDEISAVTHSVVAILKQPDSGNSREAIRGLCTILRHSACESMNTVNCEAEKWGANWVNETDDAESRAVYAAAQEGGASS